MLACQVNADLACVFVGAELNKQFICVGGETCICLCQKLMPISK